MKNRYLLYFLIGVLWIGGVNGWLNFPILAHNPNLPSGNLQHITLQLKWKHQFQFAGYYAAIHKGYYQVAGLDVTLKEAPNNIEPDKIVLEGEADFGIATSDLVLLRSQNKPVVALAAIYQHSPLIFLTLLKRGIDNIHEFVGKKLMIEHQATELLAYLKSEQVPLDKITLLPHSFDVSSLIKGEVDAMSAYSTDEPFFLQQAGINYQMFNPRSGGIDFYGDTLFTTEKYIRQHPQQVKAFVKASLKGWQYALDHPEEIIDLILTEYSQRHSREHLEFEAKMSQRLILSDIVSLGYMNEGRWQNIAETYAELGMIPYNFSLKGFIYDFSDKPNLTWLYLSLTGTLLVLGIVSSIATKFYQMNRKIKREIKERIKAELDIRKLEKRYRILAENAPFPVIITRITTGEICFLNHQATQQFDMTLEQALGNNTTSFYVNPEERNRLLSQLENTSFIQSYEIELQTTKKVKFWANISVTMIEFDDQPAIFVALMDITRRKKLEQKLQIMAMTDELTKVYNRRYFILRGNQELNRSQRYHTPFSLLIIDIDYFKKINDTFGHNGGDIALKYVTHLLLRNSRTTDIMGRLGGEEFGILLTNTDRKQAMIHAQRLCDTIAHNPVTIQEVSMTLTISIGCVSYNPNILTLDELLNMGDIALYEAKAEGRNCVVEFNH